MYVNAFTSINPFLPIYSICRWSHIQTLGWKREEVPTASTTSHRNTTNTPLISLKPSGSRFKKRYVNEALIATTTNKPHGHGQWWTPAPHIISKDSTDRVYTFDTLTNRAKIFLHYMLSSSLAAHPLDLPSTTGAADLLLQLSRERCTIEMNNGSGGQNIANQRLRGNTGAASLSSVAAEAREASVAAPVIEREEDVLSDSDDDGGPVIAFRAPPRAPSVISPFLSTAAPQASNQVPSQPSTTDSTTILPNSSTITTPSLNTPSSYAVLPSSNSAATNSTNTLKSTRPPAPLDKPAPKKRKVATTPAALTPSDLSGLPFPTNFYSTSIPLLDTGVYTIPPPPGGRNELPANYLRLKSTSNGSILYPIQSSARDITTPLSAASNCSTVGVRKPTTLPVCPFPTAAATAKTTAAHHNLPTINPTPASSFTAVAATATSHTVNQQCSSSSASASSSDLPFYPTPQDSHFTPTLTLAISGDDNNSNSTLIHGNMFTTASGQNYDPNTACLYDYENSLFR